MTAAQTPLADLLDEVPEDIVLGVHGDGSFPSYTNIPIGKLAHQAAAELRRLRALNAEQLEVLKVAQQGIESMTCWEHPNDPAHPWTDCAKQIRNIISKSEIA